jgi:hypothetical protein
LAQLYDVYSLVGNLLLFDSDHRTSRNIRFFHSSDKESFNLIRLRYRRTKKPFLEGNALQDISVRRDDFDIERIDFKKIRKLLIPQEDYAMSLDVKEYHDLICCLWHILYE